MPDCCYDSGWRVECYKKKCDTVAAEGYPGFEFTPASNLQPALAIEGMTEA